MSEVKKFLNRTARRKKTSLRGGAVLSALEYGEMSPLPTPSLNGRPNLDLPDGTTADSLGLEIRPMSVNLPRKHHTTLSGSMNISRRMSGVALSASSGNLGIMRAAKSGSMTSMNSELLDSHIVDQEDIISLTHDVRSFSDALARLKNIFLDIEKCDTRRVAAHERLGEVLCILKSVLGKYPPLHSTEILTAAGTLISKIKGYNYEEEREVPSDFYDAIDQLALAFSSSVSEYLMGDVEQTTTPTAPQSSKTRSHENLSSAGAVQENSHGRHPSQEHTPETGALPAEEIDNTLLRLESGVDLALQRCKAWSKYAKDIITYVEKKASLEMEYAKSIAKLAQNTRAVITEDSFLPFQSIYCTALDQDIEHYNTCQATCTLLQGHKFVEPLTMRRNDHERRRKELKDLWQHERKRLHDSLSNLRKARQQYVMRQQEYEKAKESAAKAETETMNSSISTPSLGTKSTGGGTKLDKKRKIEEDCLHKAEEAETTYKACVVEANNRQQALEQMKAQVLSGLRELIYQCDQTMKAVTVGYFQMQHTMAAPSPVQFQTLCESSKLYEPGTQFGEFVKGLPPSSSNFNNNVVYEFEPYTGYQMQRPRRASSVSAGSAEFSSSMDDSPIDKHGTSHPIKAWAHSPQAIPGSDTDSASGSSTRSLDPSPSASPGDPPRKLPRAPSTGTMSSGDELIDEQESPGIDPRFISGMTPDASPGPFRNLVLSKAAHTHQFRKLRTPSKCRECDSYVYFNGAECEECMLACHKKCLETLAIQCGHRKLQGKLSLFGVDFHLHCNTITQVPFVIQKCIEEIDSRALMVKGIYRVNGVKSRVERLCQSFENAANLVDLSNCPPHDIANVLKLYIRQLPEPLLTFRLYPEFVKAAKDSQSSLSTLVASGKGTGNSLTSAHNTAVATMRELVRKLPKPNFNTTALLMHHLKRVAENEDLNKMTASNLGIVFGPTLLRPSETHVTLSSLVDMPHQTRAIEQLITNAEEIFGDLTDLGLAPPKEIPATPVEVIPSGEGGAGRKDSNPEDEPQGEGDSGETQKQVPEQGTKPRVSSENGGEDLLSQLHNQDRVESPSEQIPQTSVSSNQRVLRKKRGVLLPGSMKLDEEGRRESLEDNFSGLVELSMGKDKADSPNSLDANDLDDLDLDLPDSSSSPVPPPRRKSNLSAESIPVTLSPSAKKYEVKMKTDQDSQTDFSADSNDFLTEEQKRCSMYMAVDNTGGVTSVPKSLARSSSAGDFKLTANLPLKSPLLSSSALPSRPTVSTGLPKPNASTPAGKTGTSSSWSAGTPTAKGPQQKFSGYTPTSYSLLHSARYNIPELKSTSPSLSRVKNVGPVGAISPDSNGSNSPDGSSNGPREPRFV
ncbi:PREDICTED: minor histocompatibility protein HA-1-like isoform X4 [Branchiostoma belcheri]|uniref:Minor histocompatibility protein HA-1-like isoform X4 n=1 Tax=Branchiostoma belcheri TaxID=7741 RepID=A0A6P5AR37_BRABE|nr:PREDICTED: minor histocompatibility protein HA-1-like isoform X4 [Branchiostoma belcheri]